MPDSACSEGEWRRIGSVVFIWALWCLLAQMSAMVENLFFVSKSVAWKLQVA